MMNTSNNFLTENVFTIDSEKDLTQAFRLRDQKKLVLPNNLKFPMNIRSYYTWRESSGVYTFLLYKAPHWDRPRGIAFKRSHHSGEPVGGLCNWCNAYGTSEEIGMLSVTINANTSYGYFICQDLRCIEKIEEAAALAGRSPEKWISQLYQKMNRFFENISNYKPD